MNCIVCNGELPIKSKKFCSKACMNKYGNAKHQNYKKQQERGTIRKARLILLKGGCCELCKYKENYASLSFHHIDPSQKEFEIDIRKCSNSNWETLLKEANKCKVLCVNCHFALHHPELSFDLINKKYYDEINSDKHKLTNKYIPVGLYNKCKCGKEKTIESEQCKDCYMSNVLTKISWPSDDELVNMVKNSSFTETGRRLGVSDNSVRKRLRKRGRLILADGVVFKPV